VKIFPSPIESKERALVFPDDFLRTGLEQNNSALNVGRWRICCSLHPGNAVLCELSARKSKSFEKNSCSMSKTLDFTTVRLPYPVGTLFLGALFALGAGLVASRARDTFMASRSLPTPLEVIHGRCSSANRDSAAKPSKRRPLFMRELKVSLVFTAWD
jgi:hypothetical protein